jgi:hypothetical protein
VRHCAAAAVTVAVVVCSVSQAIAAAGALLVRGETEHALQAACALVLLSSCFSLRSAVLTRHEHCEPVLTMLLRLWARAAESAALNTR